MEFIIIWLAFGIVGAMIGSKKDAGCFGFIMGVLLGPIGLLIAWLSKGNRIQCPYCKERIDPKATVCSHCQKDLPIKNNT